jgi:DNA-binding transcriptional regulator YiaG
MEIKFGNKVKKSQLCLVMTGIELKTLRKNAGLTQSELAEKIGTSKQVISTWENGRFKISNAYELLLRQVLVK